LLSFLQHYSRRTDYEVIIVEDIKNLQDVKCHGDLMEIAENFKSVIPLKVYVDSTESFSPCRKYNFGFSKSSGEYIILSSPEIFHDSNILGGLDMLLPKHQDDYLVCACRARKFKNPILTSFTQSYDGEMYMWYQHSKMRNVMFHFCSVISRDNYVKVGGFDEQYCGGIGFDDESFLHRVKVHKIAPLPIDLLVTTHIEHDRSYHDENRLLIEVNRELFLKQLASGDFLESFVGVR